MSSSELSSGQVGEGDDEEQALLERLAKREERRQRRMKEALDRQKQSIDEPSYSTYSVESFSTTSHQAFNNQEDEPAHNSKQKVKEEVKEEVIPQKEVLEEKPHRSFLREQVCLRKITKMVCTLQLPVIQVEWVLMIVSLLGIH